MKPELETTAPGAGARIVGAGSSRAALATAVPENRSMHFCVIVPLATVALPPIIASQP